MAWRGRVPTAYYCVYSQGLGSAGVAEESENYELGPARVLCANTSSFRCSSSWRMTTMARPAGEVYTAPPKPTGAATASRYRQCQPQTQAGAAGLASSLSMGPSDVQHGRGLQVITFSRSYTSMPAGSACERSDKPPAAPVRPSPPNSILRLL